jgi:anti-sigma B factor antagonist
VRWHGPLAVVALPAEIDIGNGREVEEALGSLLSMQHARALVADLTQTRFCDSAGIAVLVRAWRRAGVLGTSLRVVAPDGQVLRILQVLGAAQLLGVYPSLEDALAEQARAS